VFYFADLLFWVEIKSGNFCGFDFCKYRDLGIEIAVNPNRYLMLAADVEDENADEIGWAYDCYVSNICSFSAKLTQMVEMALIEEGRI